MKSILKGLLLAGLAVLLLPSPVLADATDLHMTTFPDYDMAMQEDRILPVTEWNEGLEGLHPGDAGLFREPQLYVLDGLETPEGLVDEQPGLLMSWGDNTDTGEIIAAWELLFPVDPDLTNMCITLTAWPRQGMSSISFSLQDINGVMKGWLWPVGAAGLPADVPTTITVAASGGPGQAGATGYWDGGVDLTQIVSMQFDESGIAQGGIPLPNGLAGFVGQWNYWHDIVVNTCPPAQPLDHFACYMVDEKTRMDPAVVSLADQFTAEDNIQVRKAKEICVPADKNGEGISNPEDHLVCYDVFSKQRVNQNVLVTNQFGTQELRVKYKVYRLCVPSKKELR